MCICCAATDIGLLYCSRNILNQRQVLKTCTAVPLPCCTVLPLLLFKKINHHKKKPASFLRKRNIWFLINYVNFMKCVYVATNKCGHSVKQLYTSGCRDPFTVIAHSHISASLNSLWSGQERRM